MGVGIIGNSAAEALRQFKYTGPRVRYSAPVISREDLRLIGQLSTVGFAFVLAIVIGFGGGYLLDEWLGSTPWLSFLGFFLGLAAGILNVYRIMRLAQKK